MEPNNIEKQIKQKLNSRQIQPSAQAWDRLDAMLSVTENKKTKRNYSWFYIAASIIGFVFIGILFFFNQETNPSINNTIIVETNTSNKQSSIKKQSVQDPLLQTNKASIKKQTNGLEIKNKKEAVAIAQREKQKATSQKSLKTNKQFVEEQDNQALVQNSPQKIEENYKDQVSQTIVVVTSEETTIEKPTKNKSKLKIDPQSLLSQVDGEIEMSFREKAIKSITKNYNEAKIALAARNQQ
jgi:ABC-type antimicrobial peptide transport system permease subunit